MHRTRGKKSGSIRAKKEKELIFSETRQGVISLIKSLNQKLNEGKALRDEEIRFLKNSPGLLSILEEREKTKKESIELPQGKLRDWVENLWQMAKILDATGYSREKDGIETFLEASGYYICDFCGYTHVLDEKCPLLVKAEELNIDLSDKPSNKELNGLLE